MSDMFKPMLAADCKGDLSKLKFPLVASPKIDGIRSFEEEFLAHIVMPNGQTMGRWAIPQIAEAYEHKRMPLALLPARGAK